MNRPNAKTLHFLMINAGMQGHISIRTMCSASVSNVSDYCVSVKTCSVTVEVIACFLLVPYLDQLYHLYQTQEGAQSSQLVCSSSMLLWHHTHIVIPSPPLCTSQIPQQVVAARLRQMSQKACLESTAGWNQPANHSMSRDLVHTNTQDLNRAEIYLRMILHTPED